MRHLAPWLLQGRLMAARLGPTPALVGAVWLAGALAWQVGLPHWQAQLDQQRRAIKATQQTLRDMDRPMPIAPRSVAQARLDDFYDTLGEARYAEQQLKTLFALAMKNGLSLTQAEYRLATDKHGRYQTYQVTLPVKGPYAAIRQFCEQTLVTVPFASLDTLHFKRDAIANRSVEARVQFTLYLNDTASATAVSTGEQERRP